MIESVTDKKANQYRLDGKALRPSASALTQLSSILGDKLVQSITSSDNQGKVDLLQLLNAWGSSLQQIQSQLVGMDHLFAFTPSNGSVDPSISSQERTLVQTISKLTNLVSIHRQHQSAVQSVKVQLDQNLIQTNRQIQALEKEVDEATQQILTKAATTATSTLYSTSSTPLNSYAIFKKKYLNLNLKFRF